MKTRNKILTCLINIVLISGCNDESKLPPSGLEYLNDWPVIKSSIQKDEQIEIEVARILSLMTLEEKVGQMIQPEFKNVTIEEAKAYKIGSVLNGGGSAVNDNKHASAADWAKKSDEFWNALENAYEDRGFKVPFMWATDAVHGNNNIYQSTIFPHNIGLGAARDPELIYRIGLATAKEITATGIDWTFAPAVAVPRDYRWGRVYEGYSEDPTIVYDYAGRMVEGLQGGAEGLKTQEKVIANVKVWIGDGGTFDGVDRGENRYTEEELINIHSVGHISGLNAGAQVVMTSFNSWVNAANYDPMGSGNYNYKVHGSQYLIQDILKDKMGFDGIVVTDWNGQQEINGCTASNCPQAVNAGNDILMTTANSDWKGLYNNIVDQVNSGVISIERINDAVTRILRVKMRAGLWDKPMPSERLNAGKSEILGSEENRAVAKEAVSKSLVLLKNNDNVLPLNTDASYLLVGSGINDIQKQTGGWTLTWQGTDNTINDFPNADTMKSAMIAQVGEDNIYFDPDTAPDDAIAIVVIGEDPYAEMKGDLKARQTLEFASIKSSYGVDSSLLKEMKSSGRQVVTIFYSGRPLYVNEEINNSDAFVAAWLPGTEASGITDVLFNINGAHFTGKLSFSWPKTKCSTSINRIPDSLTDGYIFPEGEQDITEEEFKPLFSYGYGLSYSDKITEELENSLDSIALDGRDYGCGQTGEETIPTNSYTFYGSEAIEGEIMTVIGNFEEQSYKPNQQEVVSAQVTTSIIGLATKPINYHHQFDALEIEYQQVDGNYFFHPTISFIATVPEGLDLSGYEMADSSIQFDVKVISGETDALNMMVVGDRQANEADIIPIGELFPPVGENWSTIKISMNCLANVSSNKVSTPVSISSSKTVKFNIGDVRIVPSSIDAADDAMDCSH